MSYKISIIIPVYNAEKTLQKAVDSLFSQNWNGDFEKDIEIILIDDNSSDNSLKIIEKLYEKHDNINYHSFKDNSGFGGRGRNKGLEMSQGEYVIFMDNDDIYLQDSIQTLYDSILETKSDIIFANYETDFLAKQRLYCPEKYNKNMTINPTENQRIFDIVSTTCSMAPWAKIYNKNFLVTNNIQFKEDSQFDDAEFFIKCILSSNQITILPKTYVYMYYTYEDSQVRTHDKHHFDARLKTMKEMDDLITNDGFSSEALIKYCLMELFLIISNSNATKKEIYEMFDDLSDYQSKFGDFTYPKPELNILNKYIMSKHYNTAYIISKFYSVLYNNAFIRKMYRSINNAKKSSYDND